MNKEAGFACPLPDASNRCSSEKRTTIPDQIETEDQKDASMSLASLRVRFGESGRIRALLSELALDRPGHLHYRASY
jgi:hypothetical protein